MLSLQCAGIPGPLGGKQHGPVPAGGLTTNYPECRPGPQPVGQHHCQRSATTGMPLEPLLCRLHIWGCSATLKRAGSFCMAGAPE